MKVETGFRIKFTVRGTLVTLGPLVQPERIEGFDSTLESTMLRVISKVFQCFLYIYRTNSFRKCENFIEDSNVLDSIYFLID